LAYLIHSDPSLSVSISGFRLDRQGTLKMSAIEETRKVILFAIKHPLSFLYILLQRILDLVFSPAPPLAKKGAKLRRPRLAVIGAGLTGVSSAAHWAGHGFDVQIFEAASKKKGLGGIWSVSGFEFNPFFIWPCVDQALT
jgi:hypothetical protein